MRDYAKLQPTFWIRGSGKKLRGHKEAQIVALYLFSAPTSSMLGLFYLPLATIAHETGLTLDEVQTGLAKVAEEDIAHYDPHDELVWLPAGIQVSVGRLLAADDKRVKGLLKDLLPFGGHRFVGALLHRYGATHHLAVDGVLPSPLGAPSKPLPSSREAPSGPDGGDGTKVPISAAGSPFEAPSKPVGVEVRVEGSGEVEGGGAGEPEKPAGAPPDHHEPEKGALPPSPRSSRSTKQDNHDVERVFEAYASGWDEHVGKGTRPKLTEERRTKVRARLREFDVETLVAAARGIWRSTWHVENHRTSFELAIRGSNIERFADLGATEPRTAQVKLVELEIDGADDDEKPPLPPSVAAVDLTGVKVPRSRAELLEFLVKGGAFKREPDLKEVPA